jgi:large subunit ribosomal protein L29
MDIEKIRNTTEAELRHQERELSDQLFRLKFQLKMGQTESLEKIRGLRKDIARIKTISRQRELGLVATGAVAPEAQAEPAPKKARAVSAAAHRPAKKSAAKAAKGRKLTGKGGKAKTEKK